jgi:hypothetical protein
MCLVHITVINYKIIVYMQYSYYTILYRVYSLFCIIKYSNCTPQNERVFDFTTRLITGRVCRELYLDTILDYRVLAMPKRFTYITVFDGLFTVGRACLEFTHSWRVGHRILLFYSNSMSLHEVNCSTLGLLLNTDNVTTISFAQSV